MKKILGENLLLKIIAAVAAVILWFVVLNIDNPTDTFIISNIPITVLNEADLTEQGLIYELPDDATVSIEVTTRRTDKKKISADDFEATIDLNEIYAPTGSVAVTVSAIDNKNLIRSMTQITRSMEVVVEQIQTKDYDIEVRQSGTPAESITFQVTNMTYSTVTVTAPESVMRDIADAAVEIDVDRQGDDIVETQDIVLYDIYGEEIEDPEQKKITMSVEKTAVTLSATKTNKINIDVSVTGQDAVAAGYKFITYTCDPQTVEVTGVKMLVADFDKIQIEEDLTGASGTFSRTYSISDYLPEGLEVADGQPSMIKISYQIDPITSRDFQISYDDIDIIGKQEGFVYTFEGSGMLKVTLEGLEEDLTKIKNSDIQVSLDLSDITYTGTFELLPQVTLSGSYAGYSDSKADRIMVTVTEETEETEKTEETETSSAEETEETSTKEDLSE